MNLTNTFCFKALPIVFYLFLSMSKSIVLNDSIAISTTEDMDVNDGPHIAIDVDGYIEELEEIYYSATSSSESENKKDHKKSQKPIKRAKGVRSTDYVIIDME